MSSTELQAALLIGGSADVPKPARRRSSRAKRSSSRRAAAGSIAWGSLDGLESQVLGQAGGPRRLEPPSGFTFLHLVGAGLLVLSSALVAHWLWQQSVEEPFDPSPSTEATSAEAPMASVLSYTAPADALQRADRDEADTSNAAQAAQAEASLDQQAREGAREPGPAAVVPTAVTAPVVAPFPVPTPSRPNGRKLGPAPVPTLFLDDVPLDPDASNHEPVTLELFKATLPERSAGTDPQRHAAGAVSTGVSIR